ncbi:MAG: hypothetical protein COS34_01235 [Lysobacterales bacterium CG02_land_8_20_14_3_00_62_12]|nr:MAG: hypothetical protein COS34_01235 [Xanthomonadales bacterium CG02_land_8_20_14_3_00_62_12]
MNAFVTLLQREFWEHRGGFLWAPLVVISVFVMITLMGLTIGEAHIGGRNMQISGMPIAQMLESASIEKQAEITQGIQIGLASMAMLVQIVLGFVLFFYLLGALFDDRKDRSILFWKSMPVSDLQTVASKVASAAVVAPVLAWAASIVFHLLMLGLLGGFLAWHGVSPIKVLWGPAEPWQLWAKMLVAIPVNALWALPCYGWLLLVSSWARSKPFLWAVFVPVLTGLLLAWFDMLTKLRIPDSWYWTHIFSRGLFSVFPYSWSPGRTFSFGYQFDHGHSPADLISWTSISDLLGGPNLWLGALAGMAMLVGAIYLRRYREIAD